MPKLATLPTALITGASRGIGAAIADALAPTHTLLLAGRPSPALQATADRFGATTLTLDVTDTDAIPAATAAISELADVLTARTRILGPAHPQTTMTARELEAIAMELS